MNFFACIDNYELYRPRPKLTKEQGDVKSKRKKNARESEKEENTSGKAFMRRLHGAEHAVEGVVHNVGAFFHHDDPKKEENAQLHEKRSSRKANKNPCFVSEEDHRVPVIWEKY